MGPTALAMRLACLQERSLLIVIARAVGPKQSLRYLKRLLRSARNDKGGDRRTLPAGTPQVDNLISLPHIYIGDFTLLASNLISDEVCQKIRGEIAKIFRPRGDRDGREATVIR